jgi:PIN domain nuclease of toxin-antitoxin system
VTYLLDTHALIWSADNDARLGANARAIILDSASVLAVSVASAWELSIKAGRGDLQLTPNVVDWFTQATQLGRIKVLPVELDHLTDLETLPRHHGDPFDRLIICQARALNLTILTRDHAFSNYGVNKIW